MAFQFARPISRVSHGKPHNSGRGWLMTLDCGCKVYDQHGAGVGTQWRCSNCNAPEPEGCGGDAVLDRSVS